MRVTSVARTEAATGTFEYVRGALETTVSRNLGSRLAGAVTGAIGSSIGRVPFQRRFFIGGSRTVRGQRPGTQSGDAFWFTRAEVGTRSGAFRPVLFADLGWAGNRQTFGRVKPQRGAGFGFGVLDGLLRFDLARGLHPNKGWRLDLYLEAPL